MLPGVFVGSLVFPSEGEYNGPQGDGHINARGEAQDIDDDDEVTGRGQFIYAVEAPFKTDVVLGLVEDEYFGHACAACDSGCRAVGKSCSLHHSASGFRPPWTWNSSISSKGSPTR